MIAKLEVIHYPLDGGSWETESLATPSLEAVHEEIRTMDPFAKPIATLLQNPDITDGSLMMLNGGNDLYHVQIADEDACWIQAFDPSGSEEDVQVWSSDQGFSCARKLTWNLDTTLDLVRHYFLNQSPHPGYSWE